MSVEDHRKVFLPLRDRLRQLYHSRTPTAMRFQYAVIVVDLAIIAFFIVTPVLQEEPPSCGLTTLSRRCSAQTL